MKRVMITGVNSRIGRHLAAHLDRFAGQYEITLVSLRDEIWQDMHFEGYDALVHLAALVHHKENGGQQQAFFDANAVLPAQVAKKAKHEGVGCMIFASTLAVLGLEGSIRHPQRIDAQTSAEPVSLYGRSKLEGEQQVLALADEHFQVGVMRIPLVYGRNAKGNYGRLRSVAIRVPIVPDVNNEKSAIHMDNLSEFMRLWMDAPATGVFYPQNREPVGASDMIVRIAQAHGKSLRRSKFLGWFVEKPFGGISLVEKLFGSLTIDPALSDHFSWRYNILPYQQSFEDERRIETH